jgi:hypothetical protein
MRGVLTSWKLPVLGILAVAWFLAGNHCSLFAFSSPEPAHSCCEGKQTPAHKACNECCGHLAAPVPSASVAPVALVSLAFVMLPEESPVVAKSLLLPDGGDSGASPPGNIFVAFVLGSSLNSHAPPVFVS